MVQDYWLMAVVEFLFLPLSIIHSDELLISVTRPCLLFCCHTLRTELAHISEKSTVILEKYYNLIKHEKRDKPTGTR